MVKTLSFQGRGIPVRQLISYMLRAAKKIKLKKNKRGEDEGKKGGRKEKIAVLK